MFFDLVGLSEDILSTTVVFVMVSVLAHKMQRHCFYFDRES